MCECDCACVCVRERRVKWKEVATIVARFHTIETGRVVIGTILCPNMSHFIASSAGGRKVMTVATRAGSFLLITDLLFVLFFSPLHNCPLFAISGDNTGPSIKQQTALELLYSVSYKRPRMRRHLSPSHFLLSNTLCDNVVNKADDGVMKDGEITLLCDVTFVICVAPPTPTLINSHPLPTLVQRE